MIQEPIINWMRKSEEQRWMGNAFRSLCWFCDVVSHTKSNTNIWCLEWRNNGSNSYLSEAGSRDTKWFCPRMDQEWPFWSQKSIKGWADTLTCVCFLCNVDEQTPRHVCTSYVLWMERRKSKTRSIRAISLCFVFFNCYSTMT